MRLICLCCRQSFLGDVWYDCRCFLGRKDGCATCALPLEKHDAAIAAAIRERGWDKSPSPGMRDYLTPGWRQADSVIEDRL